MCVCINVCLGEWITPAVTGDRPPPIEDFTLTSVTNNTAVLFGGTTTNGFSDDIHIINFTKTSVVSLTYRWYILWGKNFTNFMF